MKLALFDFDGTISNRDSFLLFMQKKSITRFLLVCCVFFPKILLYLIKKYPNQKLKEEFLHILFKGTPIQNIEEFAISFSQKELHGIIRPGALKQIETYKQEQTRVVVVTASPRLFLEPWCKYMGIEIIGTEIGVDANGLVTGKLAGLNCMGKEKVIRIQKYLDVNEYTEVFVYGDSGGDTEMLTLATSKENQFYKPFR